MKNIFPDESGNILPSCRKKIDAIDAQIIELLAKRFEVVKKVGEFKQENNIPFLQPERWRQVMESRIDLGQKS